MIIYKITNKINNKCYVGKTTKTLEWRWKVHIRHSKNVKYNALFPRAIAKYGEDNFILEIIDMAISLEELNEKEKYWIKYYKSYLKEYGYNLTLGGEGGALVGEALERMKKTKKGKKHSEKQKATSYVYLKGINKGKANGMYGKKPANCGKTMEEFFGEEKANEIKNNIRNTVKQSMKNSVKYQKYLANIRDKYYKNPKHCSHCGKVLEYKSGYIPRICNECKEKRKIKNDR